MGCWFSPILHLGCRNNYPILKHILYYILVLYFGDLLGFFSHIVFRVLPSVYTVLCLISYVYECSNCLKYSVIPHLNIKYQRSTKNLAWYYRSGREGDKFWKAILILCRSWEVEHNNWMSMTSISMRPDERLEGTLNFNNWKDRILNILEVHD